MQTRGDVRNILSGICKEINVIFQNNRQKNDIPVFEPEQNKSAIQKKEEEKEKACVCGACVICTNAKDKSVLVHILKNGKK